MWNIVQDSIAPLHVFNHQMNLISVFLTISYIYPNFIRIIFHLKIHHDLPSLLSLHRRKFAKGFSRLATSLSGCHGLGGGRSLRGFDASTGDTSLTLGGRLRLGGSIWRCAETIERDITFKSHLVIEIQIVEGGEARFGTCQRYASSLGSFCLGSGSDHESWISCSQKQRPTSINTNCTQACKWVSQFFIVFSMCFLLFFNVCGRKLIGKYWRYLFDFIIYFLWMALSKGR